MTGRPSTGSGSEADTGYLGAAYASSLSEFGRPLHLEKSDGWLLEREFGHRAPARDAMGAYPFFACRHWARLEEDLESLAGTDLVSVALVADPFGDWTPEGLRRCFPDRLIPFKEHFVTDLNAASLASVPKHHRYYARRALAQVEIDVPDPPTAGFLDEWVDLYGELVARHGLVGIKAFSRSAFERQLRIPGTVVLRAREAGTTVAAHIWYVQGEVAYSHLAAASARGYELMAAYALYSAALDHFRGKVRWLEIGAGAGADSSGTDGLTRFKRGWSTGTRAAWFCGRILDRARYDKLAQSVAAAGSAYFPSYRSGEFG